MSFDLPADLQREVTRHAEEAQITPDEFIQIFVSNGLRQTKTGRLKKEPPLRTDDPERTIGLFADLPDFVEVMEKVIASREERYSKSR